MAPITPLFPLFHAKKPIARLNSKSNLLHNQIWAQKIFQYWFLGAMGGGRFNFCLKTYLILNGFRARENNQLVVVWIVEKATATSPSHQTPQN